MSAPALAPKLTYAQVAAGVSASARFTARAAHDLHYQDLAAHDRLTGWVAEIQTDTSGPQPTIPWPSLGELVLPHVRLAEGARDKGYGEVYIVEEAWERWHEAMLSLRGTETHLAAMGVMYLEAEKALASAPEEVKDALVLHETDLELVQADVRLDETVGTVAAKAAAQAHNKALDKRVWLHDLQLRQLAGPDGRLGGMSRLASVMGSHVTRASREAAQFNKNNALLRAAVSAKEGIPEEALDDEDVALGVSQLLASAAAPPMLLPQPQPPGGTARRSYWREAAAAWKAGATCSEARLAGMLAAHTATAAATIDSVAALLGVDQAGRGLVGDQARAYHALATVAQRLQILGSAAPFGPAALVELGDRMAHLTDMLSAPPWSEKMVSERCDFVVATLQAARRNEERATHSTSVGGSGATETSSKLGAGTIPKHFQAGVPRAVAEFGYREVKRAVLHRLSIGGAGADLDALQAAATGTAVLPGLDEPRRYWVPLLTMIAEGPVRGVQADLVDPELSVLSTIARVNWPALVGRTVAQQITLGADDLSKSLQGLRLPEVVTATSGDDWSSLDLGSAYRKARSCLRDTTPKKPVTGLPYASHRDVVDALTVAEAVMTLRGFPGAGKNTLPYALAQVEMSWRLYGGDGSTSKIRKLLADQGRAYIVEILQRFGQLRHAVISGRNPEAPPYDICTPESARTTFDEHTLCLKGSLRSQKYQSYRRDLSDIDDDEDSLDDDDPYDSKRSKRGSSSRNSEARGKRAPKAKRSDASDCSVRVHAKQNKVVAIKAGERQPEYSLDLIYAGAKKGSNTCVPGLVAASWGEPAALACCPRAGQKGHEGVKGAFHQWKPGCRLSKCRADGKSDKRERFNGEGTRESKRARGATSEAAAEEDDSDDGSWHGPTIVECTDAEAVPGEDAAGGQAAPSAKRPASGASKPAAKKANFQRQ